MVRTRQQTTTAVVPNSNTENSHSNTHVKRQALENNSNGTEQPAKKRAALGELTNATQRLGIGSTKGQKPQMNKQTSKSKQEQPRKRSNKQNEVVPLAKIDESEFVVGSSKPPTPSQKEHVKRRSSRLSSSLCENDLPSDKMQECMDITEEVDYDIEVFYDIAHVSAYARDIFRYYRTREAKFACGDYIKNCRDFNSGMRATLVDWMVEIQEQFELNHETLYQAVKIVDIYISKHLDIDREEVQLIGSVALFVSAKFDERQPPMADDFLYVCDDAYTRDEFMEMERRMLITLDFDIGMPISYRFVRRYAKATKADVQLLTLARYILEASLMCYEFVTVSDSLMAASALALARHMTFKRALKLGNDPQQIWTSKHTLYSEYNYEQLAPVIYRLNNMLLTDITKYVPEQELITVFTKYSHEVFHAVATKFLPLRD